ncbi:MAG: hypothetical protein ACJASM_000295 [Salibacteraceae bacterium]|jgi:hypothetical protein
MLSKVLAWKKSLITMVLLIVLLILAELPSDLRSQEMKEKGIAPEMTIKGQDILRKMATYHGDTAYYKYKKHVFRFKNNWNFLPGLVYRPWVINNQEVQMTCQIGSDFTNEALMMDGPSKGEIWGITKKKAYTRKEAGAAAVYETHKNRELWLSCFQFFFEIPFRTADLPFVQYMGTENVNGIEYLKVFATWVSMEPSHSYDQLIFYVNPANYRLDFCHYTARDSGWGFFTATMKWSDYGRVAGILEPYTSLINFGGPNTKFFGSYFDLHDSFIVEKEKYLDESHGAELILN